MRLIDADALADVLFDQRKNYPQWVADIIGNMPEAVVRCKDCKHGEPCNEGDVFCTKDIGTTESSVHKPLWFCADGKRREENG